MDSGQDFLHDRPDQQVRMKEKEELQAALLILTDLQYQTDGCFKELLSFNPASHPDVTIIGMIHF